MASILRFLFKRKEEDDIPEMKIPKQVSMVWNAELKRYIIGGNEDEVRDEMNKAKKMPTKNTNTTSQTKMKGKPKKYASILGEESIDKSPTLITDNKLRESGDNINSNAISNNALTSNNDLFKSAGNNDISNVNTRESQDNADNTNITNSNFNNEASVYESVELLKTNQSINMASYLKSDYNNIEKTSFKPISETIEENLKINTDNDNQKEKNILNNNNQDNNNFYYTEEEVMERINEEVFNVQDVLQNIFNNEFRRQNEVFSEIKITYEGRMLILQKEVDFMKDSFTKNNEEKIKQSLVIERLKSENEFLMNESNKIKDTYDDLFEKHRLLQKKMLKTNNNSNSNNNSNDTTLDENVNNQVAVNQEINCNTNNNRVKKDTSRIFDDNSNDFPLCCYNCSLLESRNDLLSNSVKFHESCLIVKEKENELLSNTIANLENDIAIMNGEMEKLEIFLLENKDNFGGLNTNTNNNDENENKYTAKEEINNFSVNEVNSLKEKNREFTEIIEMLYKENNELQSVVMNLNSERKEKELSKMNDLKETLGNTDLIEKNKINSKEKDYNNSIIESLTKDINNLSIQMEDLKQENLTLNSLNNKLNAENNKLSTDLSSIKERINSLLNEEIKLKEEIENNVILVEQNSQLQEKIRQSENEISILNKKLSEWSIKENQDILKEPIIANKEKEDVSKFNNLVNNLKLELKAIKNEKQEILISEKSNIEKLKTQNSLISEQQNEINSLKEKQIKIESILSVQKVLKTKILELEKSNFFLSKEKEEFSQGYKAFASHMINNPLPNIDCLSIETKNLLTNIEIENVFPQIILVLNKITNELSIKNNEANIINKEKEFLQRQIRSKNIEIEIYKTEADSLNKIISNTSETVNHLKKKNKELSENCNTSSINNKEKLKLEQKVNDLVERMNEKTEEYKKLENEFYCLNQKLKQANSIKLQKEKEIDSFKNIMKSKANEIAELKFFNEKRNNNIKDIINIINKLETLIYDSVNSIRNDLDNINSNILKDSSFNNTINRNNDDVCTTQNEEDLFSDRFIINLSSRIKEILNINEKLVLTNNNSQLSMILKDNEISRIKNQVKTLNLELLNYSSICNANKSFNTKIEALNKLNEDSQYKLLQLNKEKNILLSDLESYKNNNDKKDKEITDLNSKINNMNNMHSEVISEKDIYNKHIEELNIMIKSAQKKEEDLNYEITLKKEEIEKLTNIINIKNEEAKALNNIKNQNSIKISEYVDITNKNAEEIENLNITISNLNKEIDLINSDKNKLIKERDEINNELLNMKEKDSLKRNEINLIIETNNKLQESNNELMEKNIKLEDELKISINKSNSNNSNNSNKNNVYKQESGVNNVEIFSKSNSPEEYIKSSDAYVELKSKCETLIEIIENNSKEFEENIFNLKQKSKQKQSDLKGLIESKENELKQNLDLLSKEKEISKDKETKINELNQIIEKLNSQKEYDISNKIDLKAVKIQLESIFIDILDNCFNDVSEFSLNLKNDSNSDFPQLINELKSIINIKKIEIKELISNIDTENFETSSNSLIISSKPVINHLIIIIKVLQEIIIKDSSKSNIVEELKQELLQTKEKFELANYSITDSTKSLLLKQEEISVLQSQLLQLENESSKIKENLSYKTNENDKQHEYIEKLEEDISNYKKDIEKLHTEKFSVECTVKDREILISKLEAEKIQLKEKIDLLEKESLTLLEKIKSLHEKIELNEERKNNTGYLKTTEEFNKVSNDIKGYSNTNTGNNNQQSSYNRNIKPGGLFGLMAGMFLTEKDNAQIQSKINSNINN